METVWDLKGRRMWGLFDRLYLLRRIGGDAARDRLRAEFGVEHSVDVPVDQALRLRYRAEEMIEAISGQPYAEMAPPNRRAAMQQAIGEHITKHGYAATKPLLEGVNLSLLETPLRDLGRIWKRVRDGNGG